VIKNIIQNNKTHKQKNCTYYKTKLEPISLSCKSHCFKTGNIKFQEINSFGWCNDTVKNSSITTKHLYLILTFRSHHEIFIRRSWYWVLPSLDATISCRIKKAVVGVTQLITDVFHIQRPTLQTEVWYSYEKSCFSFGGFLLWWPICTWNTPVNCTIRTEAKIVEKVRGWYSRGDQKKL